MICQNARQLRSLFPYPGSKWRMMRTIIPLLPDHDHFVVPFGGSGAEILSKPRSRLESFNDVDELVHNVFWVVVHGQVEELRRRVEATPSRSMMFFDEARRLLEKPITDRTQAAWAYLVAAHNSFSCHTKSAWAYDRVGLSSRWPRLPKAIDFVKRRFRHVQLFNHDWSVVVDNLDGPRTLFLCDPPYHPDVLDAGRQIYRHILTADDHERMLLKLRQVKGYVVLCGYPHPLYDRLLKDWRRVQTSVKAQMAVNGSRSQRCEVLWINYAPDGTRIASC